MTISSKHLLQGNFTRVKIITYPADGMERFENKSSQQWQGTNLVIECSLDWSFYGHRVLDAAGFDHEIAKRCRPDVYWIFFYSLCPRRWRNAALTLSHRTMPWLH